MGSGEKINLGIHLVHLDKVVHSCLDHRVKTRASCLKNSLKVLKAMTGLGSQQWRLKRGQDAVNKLTCGKKQRKEEHLFTHLRDDRDFEGARPVDDGN
jgi:hypothetical protein